MSTPTFTIPSNPGRSRRTVDGYLVTVGTSAVALPTPAAGQEWFKVIYINQSSSSPAATITLGDASVVANGGIALPVGQPFNDVETGGGAWYAAASAASTPLLMLVIR